MDAYMLNINIKDLDINAKEIGIKLILEIIKIIVCVQQDTLMMIKNIIVKNVIKIVIHVKIKKIIVFNVIVVIHKTLLTVLIL